MSLTISRAVVQLTRQLVDIPSVTEEEAAASSFVHDYLANIADRFGGQVEKMPVAGDQFNVFASFGKSPTVTFSTHIDTVPPFFPSSEDEAYVYGRGACDAKGILASMISAVEILLAEGVEDIGLLVVVGEERGSAGAIAAGKLNRGSKFLINGEPTENRLAVGTKGALRLEIEASGKMAHSAYPELGESAIDKLLEALGRVRKIDLPLNPVLGQSTLNIGTLSGGRAPNIVSDQAKAEILIRLVDNGDSTRDAVRMAVSGLAEVSEVLCIPAVHLATAPGFETTLVKYTTDIPALGENWGKPFLLGPGSIHVAHTVEEKVPKSELIEAVDCYARLARHLLGTNTP